MDEVLIAEFNPIRFDPVYAEQTSFKKPIAHSIIAAGLVSGLIGMKLPGPGTVYLKQTLDFLVNVKINDVICMCRSDSSFGKKSCPV